MPLLDPAKGPHFCRQCDSPLEQHVHHGTLCSHTREGRAYSWQFRYNQIRDLLWHSFQNCGFQAQREQSIVRGQERPADILVKHFDPNRALVIDVGITSPMQKSLRESTTYTFLTAARQYQNSKKRKYVGLMDPETTISRPPFGSLLGECPMEPSLF